MAGQFDVFDQIIAWVKYFSSEKQSKADIKDMARGAARASAVSNASLATRARLNICQFPLLTSTTIALNTYQKANEILEQLYAQYLKLVIINQLEVVNLGKGENKLTIVGKVHQNDDALATSLDATRNNILKADITSRFENTSILKELQEALPFLETYNFSAYDLNKANLALLKEYNENFNNGNLNSSVLVEASGTSDEIKTKEDELLELQNKLSGCVDRIIELNNKLRDPSLSEKEKNAIKNELEIEKSIQQQYQAQINNLREIIKSLANKEKMIDEREREAARQAEKMADRKERDLDRRIKLGEKANEKEEKQKDNAERAEFRKRFGSVTDFDNATIRKNNQLEPSILSFSMKYHTSGGSFEETRVALGIKTISHLIQSDEMCFYINETLTKNKKVFRIIQVLTGEKEFSLRFLLHLDDAKRDAKADSTTAKWWRHLKDRRVASWLKTARGGDPFVPNATILMSYEDYETLKVMYKKDIIKDTKLAWRLTDLLFLMHLVIVNDVNNEIMLFNKDTRNWETFTLDKLQQEINTMNKMSSQR